MAISEAELAKIELSKDEQNLFTNSISKGADGADGDIQQGKIVEINKDFAMVDIGGKSEKKLDISEITGKDGELLFKKGDLLAVFVSGGRISHKKAQRLLKAKDDLEAVSKKYGENIKNKIIEVRLLSKAKNGFIAQWSDDGKEIECFLPFRESAISKEAKFSDKVIKVCITKLGENSVIISRKRYFDIADKVRGEKMKELMEGDKILRGEVVSVTDFGIFVNIDGVEGMIHASELSHKNFATPSQLYKVGDIVEAKVLKFDEAKSKLSLSIKALTKDPWEDIATQLQVGYTIKAVVSSIKDYGAFVDAGNDIEGFLHITEMAWEKNIKNPHDYLQVGQEIDVEIIELDTAKKRLRVSLKKLIDKPFTQFVKKYKEGDSISGEVATITDFGAFVRFGKVDGLLHNEDLSWERKDKCKDKLKVGETIEVRILKIDREKEKISLSRKALLQSPASIFGKTHKIGEIVKGEVVSIKDFGVFVKIDSNVDALIQNEDLSPLKKDEIKLKDSIEACIVHIDNSRIRLSVRKLSRQKEQNAIENYNKKDDGKMTLGDILKDKMQ
ncbi:S1 RNA-binding domain-containing protein [Helicobacter sp. 23-1044]